MYQTHLLRSFVARLCVAACVSVALICSSSSVAAFDRDDTTNTSAKNAEPYESATRLPVYDWNLNQPQRPLLSLPDRPAAGIDQTLAYPMGQFKFPLLQSLILNGQGRYLLTMIAAGNSRSRPIELQEVDPSGSTRPTGSEFFVSDNKGVKTVRTSEATEYTFVRFSDNTFRCIRVKPSQGPQLMLVYTRDNLIHSIVDANGRMIRFNYEDHHIASITQTWIASAAEVSRTWNVGVSEQPERAHASYAAKSVTAGSVKALPNNAITREYTPEMVESDRLLAKIFGGPDAVAGANGFEPVSLANQYPLYRGDLKADDGRVIRGHLSYAMHLYGNPQGTGDSPLYVPAGFTAHSTEPGPTDAAVTFYYPQLGNLTDVTLAVFHVANFKIVNEGGRVRIGNIGGAGGSFPLYKHSHIEFYRGNCGLPAADLRSALRIDPTGVFGSNSNDRHATENRVAPSYRISRPIKKISPGLEAGVARRFYFQ
jgi:hypothetical protein